MNHTGLVRSGVDETSDGGADSLGAEYVRAQRVTVDSVPPHNPAHARRRRRLVALANFLDNAVRVPGTNFRFGADAVIGLVPGVGDVVTTLLAAYIVIEGARMGASRDQILRMVFNVLIDFAIGLVPVAGDAADVLFKANTRNLEILGICTKK